MNKNKDIKADLKKRKISSYSKKSKNIKTQGPINNFEKLYLSEKSHLNKSQINFLNSPKIQIGHR